MYEGDEHLTLFFEGEGGYIFPSSQRIFLCVCKNQIWHVKSVLFNFYQRFPLLTVGLQIKYVFTKFEITMHFRIYATVYYSLSETKMLTICVIKQIIVTHLLGNQLYRNSFFPSSIKLWNNLTPEIRSASTVSSFKKSLINDVNLLKPSRYYSYGCRVLNVRPF